MEAWVMKVLEVWKTVMHAIKEYGCMPPDSRSSETIFLTTLLTDKNMQLLVVSRKNNNDCSIRVS